MIAFSATNHVSSNTEVKNSLLIFSDGELVYSSPEITYLSEPVDFNVDIRNARIITLINPVHRDGYLHSDILLSNMMLSNEVN